LPESFSTSDETASRRQDAEDALFAQLVDVPFLGSRVQLQVVIDGAPIDATLVHSLGYKARGYWVTNMVHEAAGSGYRSPTRYSSVDSLTTFDDSSRMTLRFGDDGTYTLQVF
jgi:hypothetical protein